MHILILRPSKQLLLLLFPVLALSQMTTLNSSKLKEFEDDTFKFDRNGTVEKEDITCNKQFPLLPLWFQKNCAAGNYKNQGLFRKG